MSQPNDDDLARERAEALVAEANRFSLRRAAKVRREGRLRYVITAGVLRMGLVVALAVLGVGLTVADTPPLPMLLGDSGSRLVRWIPFAVLAGLCFGTAWGLWFWRVYERRWFPLLDGDSRCE